MLATDYQYLKIYIPDGLPFVGVSVCDHLADNKKSKHCVQECASTLSTLKLYGIEETGA